MSLLTSDYIGSWYFVKKKNSDSPYYLLKSISNDTTFGIDAVDLIQGDAGVLVIDQKEQREKTTLSGNALILKNASGVNNVETNTISYKDIIDLLIEDYYKLLQFFFLSPEDLFISDKFTNNQNGQLEYFGILLSNLGIAPNNTNLLSNASIQLGESITASLNYETRYDKKFDIVYAGSEDPLKVPPGILDADFIAREARNYDCRYYIDGNEYRIKSGSITINIGYKELFLANTYNRLPFYSPQKHSVTGELEIIAPHTSYNSIPVEANCSVLIGDRYIELGQASIKSSYKRSLQSGGEASTITVNFTAYARLGAGIDSTRWNSYYIDLLNKFVESRSNPLSKTDLNWELIFNEIKAFLGIQ